LKQLPTLYILTSTGAVQQWSVWTDMNVVHTTYGHLDGKMQVTQDVIKTGKNLGKANETTPTQQAEIKAKQLWDKKVKEGYVTDLDQAAKGESDLDGIEPMLAFPIEKKEKHVEFPALVQPKLDGFRCIAIVKDGKAKLFSRTRKEITTLPHIVAELEKFFENIILDGELYNHDLKHDFNRLASIIKRDEIHPDHTLIQYHIYDVVSNEENFNMRTDTVFYELATSGRDYLKVVLTARVNNKEELQEYFSKFLAENYEGAMYRNPRMGYENKRSASLLKVKTMEDAEFKVIGVEEGSGKLMGKAGALICVTEAGKEFKAKMKGSIESLEEYLVNFKKYENKQLTVQFQGLTPDGVPRFPVGIRFRVEE